MEPCECLLREQSQEQDDPYDPFVVIHNYRQQFERERRNQLRRTQGVRKEGKNRDPPELEGVQNNQQMVQEKEESLWAIMNTACFSRNSSLRSLAAVIQKPSQIFQDISKRGQDQPSGRLLYWASVYKQELFCQWFLPFIYVPQLK